MDADGAGTTVASGGSADRVISHGVHRSVQGAKSRDLGTVGCRWGMSAQVITDLPPNARSRWHVDQMVTHRVDVDGRPGRVRVGRPRPSRAVPARVGARSPRVPAIVAAPHRPRLSSDRAVAAGLRRHGRAADRAADPDGLRRLGRRASSRRSASPIRWWSSATAWAVGWRPSSPTTTARWPAISWCSTRSAIPSAIVGNLLNRVFDVRAAGRSDGPAHAAELRRSDGAPDPARVLREHHARSGGDADRRSCRDGGGPRRRDVGAGRTRPADAGAVERPRRRHPAVGIRHVLFDVPRRRSGGRRWPLVAPGQPRRVRSGARQHRARPGAAAPRTGRDGQRRPAARRSCARRPCPRP